MFRNGGEYGCQCSEGGQECSYNVSGELHVMYCSGTTPNKSHLGALELNLPGHSMTERMPGFGAMIYSGTSK